MSALEELTATASKHEDKPDSVVVGVTMGTIREARMALSVHDELVEALRKARAALENVGMQDAYVDYDQTETAKQCADAVLAKVQEFK